MSKSAEAFRTISEVAELLDTPTHVLRFWESRFPQVKPVKRAGGRRYYRPDDVALLAGIRHMLRQEGMTIRGVQQLIKAEGPRHVMALGGFDEAMPGEDEAASELEALDLAGGSDAGDSAPGAALAGTALAAEDAGQAAATDDALTDRSPPQDAAAQDRASEGDMSAEPGPAIPAPPVSAPPMGTRDDLPPGAAVAGGWARHEAVDDAIVPDALAPADATMEGCPPEDRPAEDCHTEDWRPEDWPTEDWPTENRHTEDGLPAAPSFGDRLPAQALHDDQSPESLAPERQPSAFLFPKAFGPEGMAADDQASGDAAPGERDAEAPPAFGLDEAPAQDLDPGLIAGDDASDHRVAAPPHAPLPPAPELAPEAPAAPPLSGPAPARPSDPWGRAPWAMSQRSPRPEPASRPAAPETEGSPPAGTFDTLADMTPELPDAEPVASGADPLSGAVTWPAELLLPELPPDPAPGYEADAPAEDAVPAATGQGLALPEWPGELLNPRGWSLEPAPGSVPGTATGSPAAPPSEPDSPPATGRVAAPELPRRPAWRQASFFDEVEATPEAPMLIDVEPEDLPEAPVVALYPDRPAAPGRARTEAMPEQAPSEGSAETPAEGPDAAPAEAAGEEAPPAAEPSPADLLSPDLLSQEFLAETLPEAAEAATEPTDPVQDPAEAEPGADTPAATDPVEPDPNPAPQSEPPTDTDADQGIAPPAEPPTAPEPATEPESEPEPQSEAEPEPEAKPEPAPGPRPVTLLERLAALDPAALSALERVKLIGLRDRLMALRARIDAPLPTAEVSQTEDPPPGPGA